MADIEKGLNLGKLVELIAGFEDEVIAPHSKQAFQMGAETLSREYGVLLAKWFIIQQTLPDFQIVVGEAIKAEGERHEH